MPEAYHILSFSGNTNSPKSDRLLEPARLGKEPHVAIRLLRLGEGREDPGAKLLTAYPSEGSVEIKVIPERPVEFDLELRIPRWCNGASVSVAGESETRAAVPGSAHRVPRRWRRGDHLELRLPMAPRFVARRGAQAGRVAVTRGPQVFCLGRKRAPGLDGKDLRLLVVEHGTLREAAPDGMLRQDGRVISLRAWSPGAWYPVDPSDLSLVLTEFADPDGELVYLKAPVPGAPVLSRGAGARHQRMQIRADPSTQAPPIPAVARRKKALV